MNQSTQVIINASAHRIPLPDGMIHTVVTSPPYYSLRKYAGEQQVDWPRVDFQLMPGIEDTILEPMRCALGLEPTPEAYIGHLVLCFREVKRVLREDGVAWCVIGDSYAAAGGHKPREDAEVYVGPRSGNRANLDPELMRQQSQKVPPNLQQGDLMLIPHRLALALQADGWIVRNDVVWHKVAPMPESVSGWRWERCRVKVKDNTRGKEAFRLGAYGDNPQRDHAPDGSFAKAEYTDCPGCEKCAAHGGYVLRRGSWRHTRAHETVLMLAQGMQYFSDQERVREENAEPSGSGGWQSYARNHITGWHAQYPRNKRPVERNDNESFDKTYVHGSGRNPRSVLTPRPESYSGAHYAVYPRTLIYPLLRATAPTRVCPVCGAPWCPVVERDGPTTTDKRKELGFSVGSIDAYDPQHKQTQDINYAGAHGDNARQTIVWGYRPTCDHTAQPFQRNPGWVLDPFVGSGTTLEVCAELGVNAVGLDISPEYLDEHAKPRIGLTPAGALDTLPLFEGMDL